MSKNDLYEIFRMSCTVESYLQKEKEVRRDFCNDEPFAISLYTSMMKEYSEEDEG